MKNMKLTLGLLLGLALLSTACSEEKSDGGAPAPAAAATATPAPVDPNANRFTWGLDNNGAIQGEPIKNKIFQIKNNFGKQLVYQLQGSAYVLVSADQLTNVVGMPPQNIPNDPNPLLPKQNSLETKFVFDSEGRLSFHARFNQKDYWAQNIGYDYESTEGFEPIEGEEDLIPQAQILINGFSAKSTTDGGTIIFSGGNNGYIQALEDVEGMYDLSPSSVESLRAKRLRERGSKLSKVEKSIRSLEDKVKKEEKRIADDEVKIKKEQAKLEEEAAKKGKKAPVVEENASEDLEFVEEMETASEELENDKILKYRRKNKERQAKIDGYKAEIAPLTEEANLLKERISNIKAIMKANVTHQRFYITQAIRMDIQNAPSGNTAGTPFTFPNFIPAPSILSPK